jgi:hypothetical protein
LPSPVRPRRSVGTLAVPALLLVVGGLVVGGMAGCSRAVPTEPAPSAADRACAEVLVRLPEALGDRERRQVTSQATAAWGDGASLVVLRCGLEPLGPTTDLCLRVGAVDWVTRTGEDSTRYTSYGRSPAVEIELQGTEPEGTDLVLSEIGTAVEVLPADRECT